MARARDEVRQQLEQAAGHVVTGLLQVDSLGRVVAADASALDQLSVDPVAALGQPIPPSTESGFQSVRKGDWVGLHAGSAAARPPALTPDWEVFTQLLATSRTLPEAAATIADYAPQFLSNSQGALIIPSSGSELVVLAQWPQGVSSFDVLQMGLNDLVAVRLGRSLSARLDSRLTWRGPQPAAMAPCFMAGRLVAVVVASGPQVPDVESVESFVRRVGAHLLRLLDPI